MYQVSDNLRAPLNSQRLYLRVTPDGADPIAADDVLSLTYTASCCAGETIGIGNVCAASVTTKLRGKLDLQDQQILVEAGANADGVIQYIPLGRFQVAKQEAGEDATTITAYDAIYYAMGGTYTPADPAPTTALGVLRDVCTQAGVELGAVDAAETAVVDDAVVDEAVVGGEDDVIDVPISGDLTGLTCREMVGKMAALLGRNAVIGRDGKLQLVWFADSGVTISADDYYSGGLSLDGPITLAGISVTRTVKTTETDEDGITAETETQETIQAGSGSGTVIGLEHDFFDQTTVDAVWAEIGGLGTYRTGSCAFIGGLLTEPGDLVQIQQRDGTVAVLPVMSVQLELDGGCKCTVSASGQSSTVDSANAQGPMAQQMQRIQADIAEFKRLYVENLTATKAKITNLYTDNAWVQALFAQDITATGTIRGVTLEGVKGDLGGWTIASDMMYCSYVDADGITYYTRIRRSQDDSSVVFAAGAQSLENMGLSSDNPAKFGVNSKGNVWLQDLSVFGKLTSAGNYYFTAPYTTETFVSTYWADGALHTMLARAADGLTCNVGYPGTASCPTILQLRSQTVKVTNASGTSTLSDERMKKDWKGLDGYDAFFDALNPQAFHYIDGASGRYHLGFGAQSVEQALADSGLDNMDFGGLVKYAVPLESEDWRGYADEYGLIYTEFVALLTDQVKRLKARVSELESQQADMERRLAALEKLIGG